MTFPINITDKDPTTFKFAPSELNLESVIADSALRLPLIIDASGNERAIVSIFENPLSLWIGSESDLDLILSNGDHGTYRHEIQSLAFQDGITDLYSNITFNYVDPREDYSWEDNEGHYYYDSRTMSDVISDFDPWSTEWNANIIVTKSLRLPEGLTSFGQFAFSHTHSDKLDEDDAYYHTPTDFRIYIPSTITDFKIFGYAVRDIFNEDLKNIYDNTPTEESGLSNVLWFGHVTNIEGYPIWRGETDQYYEFPDASATESEIETYFNYNPHDTVHIYLRNHTEVPDITFYGDIYFPIVFHVSDKISEAFTQRYTGTVSWTPYETFTQGSWVPYVYDNYDPISVVEEPSEIIRTISKPISSLNLSSVALSGNYNDLKNKPVISKAAETGLFSDLVDRPFGVSVSDATPFVTIHISDYSSGDSNTLTPLNPPYDDPSAEWTSVGGDEMYTWKNGVEVHSGSDPYEGYTESPLLDFSGIMSSPEDFKNLIFSATWNGITYDNIPVVIDDYGSYRIGQPDTYYDDDTGEEIYPEFQYPFWMVPYFGSTGYTNEVGSESFKLRFYISFIAGSDYDNCDLTIGVKKPIIQTLDSKYIPTASSIADNETGFVTGDQVYNYVLSALSGITGGMTFKGTTNSLPNRQTAKAGDVYIASGAFTVQSNPSNIIVEIGDMVVFTSDGSTNTDAEFKVIQANLNNAVTSKASSSSNNEIVIFGSLNGKEVKNSNYTVDSLIDAASESAIPAAVQAAANNSPLNNGYTTRFYMGNFAQYVDFDTETGNWINPEDSTIIKTPDEVWGWHSDNGGYYLTSELPWAAFNYGRPAGWSNDDIEYYPRIWGGPSGQQYSLSSYNIPTNFPAPSELSDNYKVFLICNGIEYVLPIEFNSTLNYYYAGQTELVYSDEDERTQSELRQLWTHPFQIRFDLNSNQTKVNMIIVTLRTTENLKLNSISLIDASNEDDGFITPISNRYIPKAESIAHGEQRFVTGEQVYNYVKNIPDAPTTDGNYTLSVTVSNGTPTYTWISSNS